MLRKLMWSGLYAGFAAASALVARRLAAAVWRGLVHEEPPAR